MESGDEKWTSGNICKSLCDHGPCKRVGYGVNGYWKIEIERVVGLMKHESRMGRW